MIAYSRSHTSVWTKWRIVYCILKHGGTYSNQYALGYSTRNFVNLFTCILLNEAVGNWDNERPMIEWQWVMN